MQDRFPHINVNPDKQQGHPCIKGTRITVYDILDYLRSGMSPDSIVEHYPPVTKENIQEAVDFIKYQHSHTKYIRSGSASARS